MQQCGHLVCLGQQVRGMDRQLVRTVRLLNSSRMLSSEAQGSTRILQDLDEIIQEKDLKSERKLVASYSKLSSWRSRVDLTDHLIKNIVYHSDADKSGLIGISKPYGLPNNPAKDVPYSLQGCLPDLAEHLNIDKLDLVKTVDRYASGITLLAPSKSTKDKLQKVDLRGKGDRQLRSSYLCLVKGHANLNSIVSCRVKMKEFPTVENPLFSKVHKEPVILSDYGSSFSGWKLTKKQESIRHIAVSTVGRSSQVPLSLLTLDPSSTKNHLIRVWLAESGHPVIGDDLYDYRHRTILGQKVKWSVEHTQSRRSQILEPSIMQLLGLGKGEAWKVPTFIHCWREYLPGWLGPGNNLTIYAPPPKHFIKTLEETGICFDFKEHIKTDSIITFDQRVRKKKTEKTEDDEEKI